MVRVRLFPWTSLGLVAAALLWSCTATKPARNADQILKASAAWSHLSKDHDSFVWIGDTADIFNRFLVGRLEYALGQAIAPELLAARSDIPTQTLLGWGKGTRDLMDAVVRTALLLSLTSASLEGPEALASSERSQLHADLLEQIPRLAAGDARVALEYHSSSAADSAARDIVSWMQEQSEELTSAGFPETITVSSIGTRHHLVFQLPTDWTPDIIATVLLELDYASPDDTDLQELAETWRALQLRLQLEQQGRFVVVSLGNKPPNSPFEVQEHQWIEPSDGQTEAAMVGYFEQSGWRELGVQVWQWWLAWQSSDAAVRLRKLDQADEGLLVDLEVITNRLAELGDDYAFRADVGRSSLNLTTRHRQVPTPAEPLTESVARRLIAPNAIAYEVTQEQDFDRFLSDWLYSVEDRLAAGALREELRPSKDGAKTRRNDAYYEHFGTLRELILTEQADAFRPPYAWSIVPRQDKFPDLVVVSGTTSTDAPVQLMRQAASAVVRSVDPESVANSTSHLWVEADLGLGVPTFTFSKELNQRLAASFMGRYPKRIEDLFSEFKPHFYFDEGYWVLSTNVSLSQTLLKRRAHPDAKIAGPNLLARSVVRRLSERLEWALSPEGEPDDRWGLFRRAISMFESFESTTHAHGSDRHSVHVVQLSPRPGRPLTKPSKTEPATTTSATTTSATTTSATTTSATTTSATTTRPTKSSGATPSTSGKNRNPISEDDADSPSL